MDKATDNKNKINEYLAKIDEVIAQGKFKDNWISLSAHKTPSWYRAGRFGIFIHWGVYSVPAFGNEWYPRNMYDPTTKEGRHHLKVYGEKFEYRNFIERFEPARYDAKEWAALFRASGAKFVMPVCEHHDGVKMYASELNRWNMYALKGRDYVSELREALEAEGLTFLASNHRAEHYWFMNKARKYHPDSEIVTSEEYRDLYGPAYLPPTGHADKTDREIDATEDWLMDWLASSAEMVDKLQPSAVYFDWWIQKKEFKPYLKKFLAYYYNRAEEWRKEVTVFYKVGAVMKGCATFDVERGQVGEIREDVWQCDTAIARNSWGYTEGNSFKSPTELIQNLIDVVSKNGCFMLNVGPKSDGTICAEERAALEAIGKWLTINGEAIYSAGTAEVGFGEGPTKPAGQFKENTRYTPKDYRFTYKTGAIYVFPMGCKYRSEMTVKKLAFRSERGIRYTIRKAEILGSDVPLTFRHDEKGLHLTIPRDPGVPFPYCIKLTVD